MINISSKVKDLVERIGVTDFPPDDVHDYIKGPAIVMDAIAIY